MKTACLLLPFFLFTCLGSLLPDQALAHDIILDPGHSAQKFGTQSCSGGKEYAYNNALTATVVSYLAELGIQVDLTRKPEEEISLPQRAEKSRGKKLFISLHHDSAQDKFITTRNGHPCSPEYQRKIARALEIMLRQTPDQGAEPTEGK